MKSIRNAKNSGALGLWRWLTVLGLLSATPAWGKEPVVILLYEQGEDVISRETNALRNKLDACGYDVKLLKNREPGQVALSLQTQLSAGEVTVLVEGHGDVSDPTDPKLLVGNQPKGHFGNPNRSASSGANFPAEELQRAILSAVPSPQIWFDTCHSGACASVRAEGVGASSRWDQKTWGGATSMALADLMCSKKTDCLLWRRYDTDGDGVIAGNELDAFFAARFPARLQVVHRKLLTRDAFFRLPEEKSQCRRNFDGDADVEEGLYVKLQRPHPVGNGSLPFGADLSLMGAPPEERHEVRGDSPRRLFQSEAEAKAFVTENPKRFQSFLDEDGKVAADVQWVATPVKQVLCRKLVADAGVQKDGTTPIDKSAQHQPASKSFRLEAPQCRTGVANEVLNRFPRMHERK